MSVSVILPFNLNQDSKIIWMDLGQKQWLTFSWAFKRPPPPLRYHSFIFPAFSRAFFQSFIIRHCFAIYGLTRWWPARLPSLLLRMPLKGVNGFLTRRPRFKIRRPSLIFIRAGLKSSQHKRGKSRMLLAHKKTSKLTHFRWNQFNPHFSEVPNFGR